MSSSQDCQLLIFFKLLQTVRKMEAEVVQMCVNMFKGGKDACGTVMTTKLLFLSPYVTFCQRNYIIILYLLVYNACL